MDGGPDLSMEPRVPVGGPTVNPVMRVMPTRMIETRVPMIDLFNCLVESQKIPIFSVAGEPHNELLARIGFQANAEVLVFAGLGLIFDDYHFFRPRLRAGSSRTVMFINQASDPIVERCWCRIWWKSRKIRRRGKQTGAPDDRYDGIRRRPGEIGVAVRNRGYMGDLYATGARYEKAATTGGAVTS
jgi:V/A-type H+-transporting ATPase subunit B